MYGFDKIRYEEKLPFFNDDLQRSQPSTTHCWFFMQVIISAALYLKSDQTFTPSDHLDDKDNTTRVLNMFKIPGDDVSVKLLLESGRDIKDLVFVKPLHVRINIDCADHPLESKSGEIISTDSNLQINVSL